MAIYLGAGALNPQLADRQQAIRESIEGRRYGAERLREDVVGLGQTAINVGREYGYGGGEGRQHVASAKSMYGVKREGEADKRSERQLVMYEQQSTINNLVKAIKVDDLSKQNAYYKGSTFKALKESHDELIKSAREVMGLAEPEDFILSHQKLYSTKVLNDRLDILAGIKARDEPKTSEERIALQELQAQMMNSSEYFIKNQLVDESVKLIQSPFIPVLRRVLGEALDMDIKDPVTSLASAAKDGDQGDDDPNQVGGGDVGGDAVKDVFGGDDGLPKPDGGAIAGGSLATTTIKTKLKTEIIPPDLKPPPEDADAAQVEPDKPDALVIKAYKPAVLSDLQEYIKNKDIAAVEREQDIFGASREEDISDVGKFTGGVSSQLAQPVMNYKGYSAQLDSLKTELNDLQDKSMLPNIRDRRSTEINRKINILEKKLEVAHELGGPDISTVKDDSWDADLLSDDTFQSPLQAKLKKELIHSNNQIERTYNEAKQIEGQITDLNRYPSTNPDYKTSVDKLTKKRNTLVKQLTDQRNLRTKLVEDLNEANAKYQSNVNAEEIGLSRSMVTKTMELEGDGQVKSDTAGGFGYPYKDGEYYALAGGLHVAQHMKNMSKTEKGELAKKVYGSVDTPQAKAFLNYLDMSLDQLRDGKFKDDPNLRLTRSQRRVLTEFMWDESIEKMVKGNSFLKKRQGDTTLSKDIPPKLRHMMSDMAFRHGGGWLATRDYFGFRVLLKEFLAVPTKQTREALVSSFEITDRYEDEIVGKGRVRQNFLHGLLSDMRI